MAEPGHLPPIPHHLSSKSAGRSGYPPPLPTRKSHHQHQQQVASFHPPPSSLPPHQQYPQSEAHELQPTLTTAEEASHKSVKFKKPWGSDAENVGINVEPYESEANQNQPDDSDFEDDDFSISSSRSSMVSNAPSVQHFNISFIFKKTFREHEGARAFRSMRSILKVVYMCSLRWTYNILLFTIGILVAFLWAVINGIVAYLQAWVLSPLTRVSLVVVKGILPLVLDPLSLLLRACAEGCCGAGGCAGFTAGQQLQGGLQKMSTFRQTLDV